MFGRGKIFRANYLPRRAAPELEGDGFNGDFVVHGQWHAHRGVQHERAREYQARGAGRAGRVESHSGVGIVCARQGP